jgi:hypothetical protein
MLLKAAEGWQDSAEVSAEFVAATEDVLVVYAEPYDPTRLKVNFDETTNPPARPCVRRTSSL